eukprot:6615242-Prymnesium_polylepis.2
MWPPCDPYVTPMWPPRDPSCVQFEDDSFLAKMCGKNDNQESLCMEATAKAIVEAFDNGFDPDAA